MFFRRGLLLGAVAALLLNGCGSRGGSGMLPALNSSDISSNVGGGTHPSSYGGPRGRVTFELSVDPRQRLDLQTRYPRLPRHNPAALPLPATATLANSIKQIQIYGTVYASYVSPEEIDIDIKVPMPKKNGPFSITVPLNDIPVGNNESAYFEIDALGGGASYYLGDLAAIFNVSSPAPKITADARTTNAYLAEEAMVGAGLFSTMDLKNPKLETTVGNEVKKQHLKPDPSTGLFSNSTLDGFVRAWAPAWQRTLILTPHAGTPFVTIANDAGDTADNILEYNKRYYSDVSSPAGTPCDSTTNDRVAGVKTEIKGEYCFDEWNYTSSDTFPHLSIYGGPVIIGQSNCDAHYASCAPTGPYLGTITRLDGLAPGTKKTLALPPLQTSQHMIAVNDPLDIAFGQPSQAYERIVPDGPWLSYAPSENTYYSFFHYYVTATSPPVKYTLVTSTWNPYGLPESQFEVCSWRRMCIGAGSSKTLVVSPPFQDPGTDLAYYDWNDPAVAITSNPSGGCTATSGYHVAYNGTSFSFKTTKPAVLMPNSSLDFEFESSAGCTSDPTGMQIAVTITDAHGHVWKTSGTNPYGAGSSIGVSLDWVTEATVTKSIEVTATGAPNGVVDLQSIIDNGPSVNDALGSRVPVTRRSSP